MDRTRQREIASKGGKAAHQKGRRTSGPVKKLVTPDARAVSQVIGDGVNRRDRRKRARAATWLAPDRAATATQSRSDRLGSWIMIARRDPSRVHARDASCFAVIPFCRADPAAWPVRPCRRSARRSLLRARPRHHVSAAVHESGVDDLRPRGGADAGRRTHTRGVGGDHRRAASRRRDEPAEERLSARSLRQGLQQDPRSRRARRDERRGGRRGAGHGEGDWPVVGQMFLIFRLLRPDVLPVGDLGILTAVQKAYRLRKRPSPDRLRKIGEAWKPYRSVASWYLWRSLDNEPVQSPVPVKVSKSA